MLPGFRFLLAAIVLSMSVLVFGLGAAALLRAAHEEFAGPPAWRVASAPKFAGQDTPPGVTSREPPRETPGEEPIPVLAMLRVEPEPAQPTASDRIPTTAEPATAPTPDQPEKIAALEPHDKTSPEAAKPEIAIPEISVQSEAPAVDTLAPAEEARVAAAEQVLPQADEAVAPAAEPAIVPPAAGTGIASTRIATLGGPPVAIEAQPPAKAASAKPDPDASKKRRQARRAKERRRIALRARQAAAAQLAADPFAQPTITTRSR